MPLSRIQSASISDGAVATVDLANGAVTDTKLSAGSVENYLGTQGFALGMRNRIINGDMRIDQRNAGAAVTSTGFTYTVDRWMGQSVVDTSKFSVQQSSTVVPPNFTVSAQITSLSAYSPTTDAIQSFKQTFEVGNIADNGWGTSNAVPMTLSFWVRSSVTGTFSGAVIRSNSGTVSRSFVFTYTISSANTWEYKTVAILADTNNSAVYGSVQNIEGGQVRFDLGSSSTRLSSTVNSWQAGNFFGATGQTSLLATNGATFYITGVQLEAGSVATPFERRPYGTELALCQRYYSKSYSTDTPPGTNTAAGASRTVSNGSAGWVNFDFPVEMRAAPTVTPYNIAGTSGVYGSDAGNWTPLQTYISTRRHSASGVVTTGFFTYGHYVASSEL
jgi:hypothetical protein